jgi:hypothetical protein
VTFDPAADSRRARREAWEGWWARHGLAADFTRLTSDGATLGHTLLVLLDGSAVVEWGRDGKERWRVGNLRSPLDALVLPGGRLLVAESSAKCVTERNLKGDILRTWTVVDAPIHADRLPGGGLLIVTQRSIFVMGLGGKQPVMLYRPPPSGLVTARRFPDGRIACLLTGGDCLILDARGKELRRFAVDQCFTTNALTLLANGHILVVHYGGGRVREHDRAGKVVWEVKLDRPLSAARMANGHTLISTQGMVLIEYDRSGREVGRRPAPGHPCQVRLR